MLLALIAYWLFFYRKLIINPYLLSYGDTLYLFFPLERLCGRYWRKGKIPQDPYYYGDLLGMRVGTLYPVNIIFAIVESYLHIDTAFIFHVWNILLHQLATSLFAYYLFGQGIVGLFGALAWAYYSYHIKQEPYYVQAFTWITATLCFIHLDNFLWAGISIGMLLLSAVPTLSIYFLYILGAFWLVYRNFPLWTFALGIVLALPQIIPILRYNKKSIRKDYTLEDNIAVGCVPYWWYVTLCLPVSIRSFLFGVVYTEVTYNVTPLIFILALSGSSLYWFFAFLLIILSHGGWLFKRLSFLMTQFPQRWGYFVGLVVITMGVERLHYLNLQPKNLSLLTILLGILLFKNSSLSPHYPFSQWSAKPSVFFNTRIMRFLEANAKWYRVNNMPYPVYTGHEHQIHSVGYCGSNHSKELNAIRNLPKRGATGNDWFEFKEDGDDLDRFGIGYHIGDKPSEHPKWVRVEGFDNLWKNSAIV